MTENTASPPRYCPNCHYPLPHYGQYCSNCSQKHTTGKVRVWELLREFMESILNIDSKIFRTLGALFIPGKLTIEYFKGRHKRYIMPMRLFFVTAVAHFAVLGYVGFEKAEQQAMESNERQLRTAHLADFRNELDSVRQKVEAKFPEQEVVRAALDSLETMMKDSRSDSTTLFYIYYNKPAFAFKSAEVRIPTRDVMEMQLDSLVETYGGETVMSKLQIRQVAKLNRRGGSFTRFALGQLIWMVVLMMPFLALLLKLLYIRRRRYYVEHLVFSFHYHAFSFLAASAALLAMEFKLGRYAGFLREEILFPLIFALILIYLFIALRRFYRQHWFKTFIKYCIINFSYLLIFTVFLLLTLVASALLF